jgi:hypothetical protein
MRVSIGALIVVLFLASATAGEHPQPAKASPQPAATAAAGAGALDGKVFSGELGKAGATTGDPDTLTFEKGAFVSSACVPFGFQGAPYTASQAGGVTTFTAKATNSGGETMEWKGTLRGDALEATAVHRTSSGETAYWFKGKLGAAKAGEHPKKSEHPEHPEHPKK